MCGRVALGIGLPVGALLAWGSLLWVIPAGFLIRYLSVRNLGKYVITH